MEAGAYETAKRYIRYRFKRTLDRMENTTDSRILSLIESNNEEVKQENANKNPVVNSVSGSYMAGEVSRTSPSASPAGGDRQGPRGGHHPLPRHGLLRPAYAQLRPR